MTQDEITRMAREAGIGALTDYGKEALERFAALVAAHEREKQAEQEPVAYVYEKDVAGIGMRKDVAFTKHVEVGTDLYAAPVRTKDLTDDEMEELCRKYARFELIREAIAADREKNK